MADENDEEPITDLLYERATKTLKTEYDCKPSGLLHFLRELSTRFQQYG